MIDAKFKSLTVGERAVWAAAVVHAGVSGSPTTDCIRAACDLVLRLRAVAADDTTRILTEEERAMLDAVVGAPGDLHRRRR